MSGPATVLDADPTMAACGSPSAPCIAVDDSRDEVVGRIRVRRALPRKGRRTVGAWCFADHMGPADVTENSGPAHVFRNVTETPAKAVRLVLGANGKNRGAVGARVTCTLGGRRRIDEVSGGDGYLSVSERTVVIGLGSAAKLDAVDVRWPDGTTASAKDLAPGLYRWVEGGAPEPPKR